MVDFVNETNIHNLTLNATFVSSILVQFVDMKDYSCVYMLNEPNIIPFLDVATGTQHISDDPDRTCKCLASMSRKDV